MMENDHYNIVSPKIYFLVVFTLDPLFVWYVDIEPNYVTTYLFTTSVLAFYISAEIMVSLAY